MQNYLFFGSLLLGDLVGVALLSVDLNDGIPDGKVFLEDFALQLSQLKPGSLGATWRNAYLLAGPLSSTLIFIL